MVSDDDMYIRESEKENSQEGKSEGGANEAISKSGGRYDQKPKWSLETGRQLKVVNIFIDTVMKDNLAILLMRQNFAIFCNILF